MDCLGAGVGLDEQADGEATETVLEQLSFARSYRRHDSMQVPHDSLGERLAYKRWRVEDEGAIRGTRAHSGRTPRARFSPCAMHSAGQVIVSVALKPGLETSEADAVDAYCQAAEHEEVLVAPAPEYLKRIGAAGKHTDIVWRLRRQLPGRSAGHNWVGTLATHLG